MMKTLGKLYCRIRFGRPLIIVSGLPRSGTSMVMQMMEVGGLEVVTDNIRKADDDNPKGYYELERVKELDKGGDKSWLLMWDNIKWYESYPDVDAIELFVHEANSDKYNITDDDGNKVHSSDLVRFVRVGEDNDDITVRGNGFWDIHPVTSINW